MAELDDSIDPGRRSELLKRIQRKIADDSVNGFLFQYPRLAVWNAHLQGVGFDNLLGVVELRDAHFDAAGAVGGEDARRRAPESSASSGQSRSRRPQPCSSCSLRADSAAFSWPARMAVLRRHPGGGDGRGIRHRAGGAGRSRCAT